MEELIISKEIFYEELRKKYPSFNVDKTYRARLIMAGAEKYRITGYDQAGRVVCLGFEPKFREEVKPIGCGNNEILLFHTEEDAQSFISQILEVNSYFLDKK